MLIHWGMAGYTKETMSRQLQICRIMADMYPYDFDISCVQPLDPKQNALILYNEELRAIIEWINKNLWFRLDLMSSITAYVKYRIASSMFEKAFLHHVIDKDEFLLYTSNLDKNIAWVQEQILNETLPF